jgi:mono/diheme cytochrome c family protein
MSTTAAANIIVHGKGTMPAWGGILSKSDINDVIAYLRTR